MGSIFSCDDDFVLPQNQLHTQIQTHIKLYKLLSAKALLRGGGGVWGGTGKQINFHSNSDFEISTP